MFVADKLFDLYYSQTFIKYEYERHRIMAR